jgi:mannosyltransferase OCH1-like enzyme
VAEKAPEMLATCDPYQYQIQRADMWRMVSVQACGGFYIDLDMLIHQPLDHLRTFRCVLSEEKSMDSIYLHQPGHRARDGLRTDGESLVWCTRAP